MTIQQLQKANELQKDINHLRKELELWENMYNMTVIMGSKHFNNSGTYHPDMTALDIETIRIMAINTLTLRLDVYLQQFNEL